MKKSAAVIRIFFCFLSCICLFGYNIFKETIRPITAVTEDISFGEDNDLVFELEAEEEQITNEAPTETESKSESVVETGGGGTVKGKIISRYISPYNAALSYNKAYMKNSTNKKIDIKALVEGKLSFKLQKSSEVQVLILHTHATETFMTKESDTYTDAFLSRTRDKTKNMIAIGKVVADELNKAGIGTVQAEDEHDYPNYTGSYSRSAKTVNEYLKKYPKIKIILDIHRDAVSSGANDKVKLVTEINGRKAAQVMLVMGAKPEKYEENLKLALKLQQTIEMQYPTLARPLSLADKSYNQGLSTGAMLLEVGTDANTLDEAIYSAQLVSGSLITLLNTIN